VDPRRVVRTRVSAGEDGWVFGSGYLVAPGRVLTARHVLAVPGASSAVGDACQVRRYPCGPAEDWLAAWVHWLHPRADAAVVAVDVFDDQMAALRWGRVEGTEPVGWTAMGYPVAGLGTDDRVEEQVLGTVAPQSTASVGYLALTVTSRGARADDSGASGWAGLSGAAVFSGDVLVVPGHQVGARRLIGGRPPSALWRR
jgi:hypothetical protein